MKHQFIKILIELIIFDFNIWAVAKGLEVSKSIRMRTNKATALLFSSDIKETKIHHSILIGNIALTILEIIYSIVEYVQSIPESSNTITVLWEQLYKSWIEILIWLVVFGITTLLAMALVYRTVRIMPPKDDSTGHRHLNVKEINKEYINFSKADSIDGRSELLIIAGDLSFLGDIPDIKEITDKKRQRKCETSLSENNPNHHCCKHSCPRQIKGCVEKSEQFTQLFELKNKGITLHVICNEPDANNDILYKRRLGRLKKIFSDKLIIRFLPDETLKNGISVLGRIKVNGGIKELFWHWKDPGNPGSYIVPETKRVDSGENKTLIYLLETVLWKFSNEADENIINECVKEYEKAINCAGDQL